jgi:hypothetical protein
VENGNRAEIGKWLKENVGEKENVYLEPLGYVGYFSGRHIDDYPGLVSPEVVKLRKELPKDPQSYNIGRLLLIPKLKPDWVVLRLAEYQVLMGLPMFQEFKQQYVFWREFNVQGALSKYRYVPGEDFILFDSYFAVFRRTSSSP